MYNEGKKGIALSAGGSLRNVRWRWFSPIPCSKTMLRKACGSTMKVTKPHRVLPAEEMPPKSSVPAYPEASFASNKYVDAARQDTAARSTNAMCRLHASGTG